MSAPLDPPGGPASVTEYSEYSLYFRAGRVDRPMPASRDWASAHICTGTGLAPATSAPGMGSPLPHLHRDWARPFHICAGTRLRTRRRSSRSATIAYLVPIQPRKSSCASGQRGGVLSLGSQRGWVLKHPWVLAVL